MYPPRRLRVAYYAHHHGTGHLRHAVNIARLDAVELLVTGTLPSGGVPALPGGARFAPLPPDVAPDGPFPPGPGGFLHYAPAAATVRSRFAELNRLWQDFRPDLVVVDVSVETALFARLSGYPVIHRRMHGERTDAPHRLAYDSVHGLIGYFPEQLDDASHLAAYGTKSTYPGMLAPVSAPPAGTVPVRPRTVAVQTSLGGSGVPLEDVLAAARTTPDWNWTVMGRTAGSSVAGSSRLPLPANVDLPGVVADPGPVLAASDVIITSAGHNAVAAAAAARRPVLVIPEPRPFREQESFAGALAAAGTASLPAFAAAGDWHAALEDLRRSDPEALAHALLVRPAEFRSRFLDAAQKAVEQQP